MFLFHIPLKIFQMQKRKEKDRFELPLKIWSPPSQQWQNLTHLIFPLSHGKSDVGDLSK